jgi:transcription elongation factor Elf1
MEKHSGIVYKCKVLDCAYEGTWNNFKKHRKAHKDSEAVKIKCDVKDFEYEGTKARLGQPTPRKRCFARSVQIDHSPAVTFPCLTCGKLCASKKSQVAHNREHIVLNCKICNVRVRYSYMLNHSRVYHSISSTHSLVRRPRKCSTCKRMYMNLFTSIRALDR